jgi:CSLREA domain-containing protein
VLVTVALLAALLPAASAVQAASPILVTSTTDEYNDPGPGTGCSLREAIKAANSDMAFGGCPGGSGADQITLPPGAYKLTLTAPETTPNLAVGDLDVDGALTIVGQGSPTINANSIGRIFELTAGDSLTLRGLTLTGGSDQFGGAIRVDSATLSLVEVVVDSNAVTSNVTSAGGGIVEGGAGAVISIARSRITGNAAAGTGTGTGGGIYVQSGTLTITDSLISGNSTTGNGGGIVFAGTSLTLANVTIASNTGKNGDGLFNTGTATIRNSTFTDNGNIVGGGKGGGIFNSGSAILESDTIGANVASSLGGDGGNIYNSGTMTARNTLVDEALTSGNCGGTLPTSNGHNLDYGVFSFQPCFGPGGGNINGVDPKLGPLQDNGGPTPTLALGSGSGAIDRGISVATTPTDQRGVPRPFGAKPDIGAYERASCGGVLVNIVGTAGNDTLMGTSGPDGILGLGGNDLINGGAGDDGLCGGTGNDTLVPGLGVDQVIGGLGSDTVSYASSTSGVSVDLRLPNGVATGQGRDTISGVENVVGSAYADVIRGSDANNWLILGAGNDRAYGYGGNDRIDGGPGNDILYGLTGNDALYGGPGNDYLNGGLGRDLCRQGAGSGRRISCER